MASVLGTTAQLYLQTNYTLLGIQGGQMPNISLDDLSVYLGGAGASSVSTFNFSSRYELGPPAYGFLNEPLTVQSEQIYTGSVAQVLANSSAPDAESWLQSLESYYKGLAEYDVIFEIFEIEKIAADAFSMKSLYKNYTAP